MVKSDMKNGRCSHVGSADPILSWGVRYIVSAVRCYLRNRARLATSNCKKPAQGLLLRKSSWVSPPQTGEPIIGQEDDSIGAGFCNLVEETEQHGKERMYMKEIRSRHTVAVCTYVDATQSGSADALRDWVRWNDEQFANHIYIYIGSVKTNKRHIKQMRTSGRLGTHYLAGTRIRSICGLHPAPS